MKYCAILNQLYESEDGEFKLIEATVDPHLFPTIKSAFDYLITHLRETSESSNQYVFAEVSAYVCYLRSKYSIGKYNADEVCALLTKDFDREIKESDGLSGQLRVARKDSAAIYKLFYVESEGEENDT